MRTHVNTHHIQKEATRMRLDTQDTVAQQRQHRIDQVQGSKSVRPQLPVEGATESNKVKAEKGKFRITHKVKLPKMRLELSKEARTEVGAGREVGRGPKLTVQGRWPQPTMVWRAFECCGRSGEKATRGGSLNSAPPSQAPFQS